MKAPASSRHGFVLGLVGIILMLLIITGTVFISRMRGEAHNLTQIERGAKAFFLAEAGVNRARNYLSIHGIDFAAARSLPEEELDGGKINILMERASPVSAMVTIYAVSRYREVAKGLIYNGIGIPATGFGLTRLPGLEDESVLEATAPALDPPFLSSFLALVAPPHPPAAPAAGAGNLPFVPMYVRNVDMGDGLDAEEASAQKFVAFFQKRLSERIHGERKAVIEAARADRTPAFIGKAASLDLTHLGGAKEAIPTGDRSQFAGRVVKRMAELDRAIQHVTVVQFLKKPSTTVGEFRAVAGDATEMYAARATQVIRAEPQSLPNKQFTMHFKFPAGHRLVYTPHGGIPRVENGMPPKIYWPPIPPPAKAMASMLGGLPTNAEDINMPPASTAGTPNNTGSVGTTTGSPTTPAGPATGNDAEPMIPPAMQNSGAGVQAIVGSVSSDVKADMPPATQTAVAAAEEGKPPTSTAPPTSTEPPATTDPTKPPSNGTSGGTDKERPSNGGSEEPGTDRTSTGGENGPPPEEENHRDGSPNRPSGPPPGLVGNPNYGADPPANGITKPPDRP